jgi:hypothetical protein
MQWHSVVYQNLAEPVCVPWLHSCRGAGAAISVATGAVAWKADAISGSSNEPLSMLNVP